MDKVQEQGRLQARKTPENGEESHFSTARGVRPHSVLSFKRYSYTSLTAGLIRRDIIWGVQVIKVQLMHAFAE
jgi:hypothetical protein